MEIGDIVYYDSWENRVVKARVDSFEGSMVFVEVLEIPIEGFIWMLEKKFVRLTPEKENP